MRLSELQTREEERKACTNRSVRVIITILDEDLRACEASMNGCHVQGALPFFALWRVKKKRIKKPNMLCHLKLLQPVAKAGLTRLYTKICMLLHLLWSVFERGSS